MDNPVGSLRGNLAARFTSLYVVFSCVWIILTDQLAIHLAPHWESLPSMKGMAFIGVTAGLIYFRLDALVRALDLEERERTTAEKALRESDERLKLALAHSQTGVWEWDVDSPGDIHYSQEVSQILDLQPSSVPLTLRQFATLVQPSDAEVVVDRARAAIREKTQYVAEFPATTVSGRSIWLNVQGKAKYNGAGKPLRLIGTVADVTGRKQAEIQLEHNQQRLEIVVESALDGIITVNHEQKIILFNAAAAKMFGWAPSQALGQSLEILIPEASRPGHKEYVQRFSDRQPFAGHTHMAGQRLRVCGLRFDGSQFPLEASIAQNMLDGRKVYTAVIRDLSERIEAEENQARLESQLRQAQKMEAVGQLAGGVAHDFNNILTTIQGSASLLQDGSSPDEVGPLLQDILDASTRAARLTRQLLLFSRRQALHPRDIDLNQVIAEMSRMLGRILGEDIKLQTSHAAGTLMIHADPGLVEQVLLNLAVNARDAMPGGGELTVETTRRRADQLNVQSTSQAANFVCLSLADSGTGITEEHLPHIFEPFFTTKEVGRGTGLGLATVYGIVQEHQGWINVDSRVGRGTTFEVYLPALEATTQAAGEVKVKTRPAPGAGIILVVEDEPAVRKLTEKSLRQLGYTVLTAISGVDAERVWELQEDLIQLVVTDVVMPDGIDGVELARRLQARRPDLKVIYTSGYDREIGRDQAPFIEGVNFLAKPFTINQLAELVQRQLHPRPESGATAPTNGG